MIHRPWHTDFAAVHKKPLCNVRKIFPLRRMQTELSALERTVLMAGLEGRTPAQTARELGLPAKNVANALARARRKLRGAPTT